MAVCVAPWPTWHGLCGLAAIGLNPLDRFTVGPVRAEIDQLTGVGGSEVRSAVVALDTLLHDLGCSSYIKTIYAGYEWKGEMVAAVYPHTDRVEVAVALPEDAVGITLIDATHLTWRTMPVAAVIRSTQDLDEALRQAQLAFRRVSSGAHDVDRPAEHFMGRSPNYDFRGPGRQT